MKNKSLRNYYLLVLAGTLIVSAYPLWMGVSVISDMLRYGTVYAGDYPKYIIPYTPISLSIIAGVLMLPLLLKHAKKYALIIASALSVCVFFVSELLLESKVIVTSSVVSMLESWQMYMCYVPPQEQTGRLWTEINVLMGEYSPAFKFHFYIISLVIILSLLNCFYGFAHIIQSGNRGRLRSLFIQAIASVSFLLMCIWACFTAFYRTGEITVSLLSALLMSIFFILFGVTAGVCAASFLVGKSPVVSILIPSLTAVSTSVVMYIGEMILLSGHLYRFGNGFLFNAINGIVLAPIDIIIIIASGGITALLAKFIYNRNKNDISNPAHSESN